MVAYVAAMAKAPDPFEVTPVGCQNVAGAPSAVLAVIVAARASAPIQARFNARVLHVRPHG